MTIYIILTVITIVLLSWWLYTKTRLSKKEREVIQGCIKHYEAVIQIAEVFDDWYRLMIHNRVNGGLCYYLSKNYVSKKLQKWISWQFNCLTSHSSNPLPDPSSRPTFAGRPTPDSRLPTTVS